MAQLNGSSEMASNTQQTNSDGPAPSYPSRASRFERMQQQQQQPRGAQQQQQRQEPNTQQQQQGNNQQRDESNEPKALNLAELFAPDQNGESINSDNGDIESIDGVSKRLGVKPEDVYKVKVPMPNGAEALTIGELKDRIGELVSFETRETQFDERRKKSEGDLLRGQTELREILGQIPKEHVPAGIVDKLRKSHEKTLVRERALTLEHIPDWDGVKGDDRKAEDVAGMSELLGEYGFDDTFIDTVVDHRAMKMIRDYYIQTKRIRKALEGVTVPAKKGQRPSGKAGKAPKHPGNQQSSRRQNVMMDSGQKIRALFGDT
jgi:hypothetical protein